MNEPNEPTSREKMDEQILPVIRAYRVTQKVIHWLLGLVAVVAVISLLVSLTVFLTQSGTEQRTVTNVVSAECGFYRDIGEVPPPVKTTEFGIKILVDSRNAYIGLGCTQKLSPPTPGLISEAAKYNLELKG